MATVGSAIDIDTDSVSSDDGSSDESNHLQGGSLQMCTEDTTVRDELTSDESTGSEDTESSSVSRPLLSDCNNYSHWDDIMHGLNGHGRAEKCTGWHLRLGDVVNAGFIQHQIADNTPSSVKCQLSGCVYQGKVSQIVHQQSDETTTLGHLHTNARRCQGHDQKPFGV